MSRDVFKIIFFLHLFSIHWEFIYSKECDNITQRYNNNLVDSAETLNSLVNGELDSIIKEFNSGRTLLYKGSQILNKFGLKKNIPDVHSSSENSCDLNFLKYLLEDHFISSGYVEPTERAINSAANKGKISAHKSNEFNIYRDPSFEVIEGNNSKYFATIVDPSIILAPSIKLEGHYICTDKIGHFFSEGMVFHNQYNTQLQSKLQKSKFEGSKDGAALKSALALLTRTEYGNYGIKSTSVFSFADIASDFGGGLFWFSALSMNKNPIPNSIQRSPIGKNENEKGPYFQCNNGKLSRTDRKFDWKDYVNDAWDEGINCSEMDTITDGNNGCGGNKKNKGTLPEVHMGCDKNAKLTENILALEKKYPGYRFQCPANVNSCEELNKLYGNYIGGQILNGQCIEHKLFTDPNQTLIRKKTAIRKWRYYNLQKTCWFLESPEVDRSYFETDSNLYDAHYDCSRIDWENSHSVNEDHVTSPTNLRNGQK